MPARSRSLFSWKFSPHTVTRIGEFTVSQSGLLPAGAGRGVGMMEPMAVPSSPLHQMKLRAFDLSERTGRLGRRSVEQRVDRLRDRSFLIGQTAVTAGLAWLLASTMF